MTNFEYSELIADTNLAKLHYKKGGKVEMQEGDSWIEIRNPMFIENRNYRIKKED